MSDITCMWTAVLILLLLFSGAIISRTLHAHRYGCEKTPPVFHQPFRPAPRLFQEGYRDDDMDGDNAAGSQKRHHRHWNAGPSGPVAAAEHPPLATTRESVVSSGGHAQLSSARRPLSRPAQLMLRDELDRRPPPPRLDVIQVRTLG